MSDDPTVRGDWSCATCGYALRGLPESGVCPECGTHVQASTLLPKLKADEVRLKALDDRRMRRLLVAVIVIVVIIGIMIAMEVLLL